MDDRSAQARETTLIKDPTAQAYPSAGRKESPLRTIVTIKQDVLSLPIQPASTPSSMDSKQAAQTERGLRLWADTPQSLRRLLQDQRNTRRKIAIIPPRQASPSLGSTRRGSSTERRLRINTILSSRPSSPRQNLFRLAGQID